MIDHKVLLNAEKFKRFAQKAMENSGIIGFLWQLQFE